MSSLFFHQHAHSELPPLPITSKKGIQILKWSSSALLLTALIQIGVVLLSHSVALLADTIHNLADALTSIPLWIAFHFSRRKPTLRFSYGYGRIEDLAGVCIILIILFSAIAAGYESIQRLLHPHPVTHISAVIFASIIGFIGNEIVAKWRIRVGKEIHSAALIADGEHARIDGLTSLAVIIGAIGSYLGYPIVDAIIGILITLTIMGIVWQSTKTIFTHLLDGVEPRLIPQIKTICSKVPQVQGLSEVRARWLGHKLTAEVNITLPETLSIKEGHHIAKKVHHHLLHELPMLSQVHIHVDPIGEAGEDFHSTPN